MITYDTTRSAGTWDYLIEGPKTIWLVGNTDTPITMYNTRYGVVYTYTGQEYLRLI